ncbi:MAG: hypothetical protein KC563_12960 [Nitrospira sp.]|nr:hypothetical protein [Nitrospira sp.]MCB9711072.1 hypothetical protein [Nitrospiraceae bacterium]MDR4488353.1 hypothetical protein [Nitrospirales bacterium]MCA9466224.1 hypothetical protein [Nitrospira sp.]MCA9476696.1 hypothetical protein [Nitrospira sp.]
MTEQEKQLVVLAHALAHQETEIHYLKALLMEKMNIKIEEFQEEQDALWEKSKHYRIYAMIQTLQHLQGQVAALPEQLDLEMYRDHLRWPTEPPSESSSS